MTTTGQDLIINRADLSDARIVQVAHPDTPPEGCVLLRVDTFALTANTITYGTASESLGYWNFFPTDISGFGRIPAWGFADVLASAVPEIHPGQRVYGYVPMSTHLMVQPGRGPSTSSGFTDIAPHRQAMSPIYNRYTFTTADPGYASELEPQIALFRPLFTTAFLLADFLREHDGFGASLVLLSSASSKTAMGLAADLARDRPEGLKIVGLTSAGNRAFVESLRHYDHVLSYDDLTTLSRDKAVYVDFSGNGNLLRAIHGHFDTALQHTAQVGLTDWQHAELKIPGLPGPKPQFFFAPSQAQARIKDWGLEGFQAQLATAWAAFIATTGWLSLHEHIGPDAVLTRYLSALYGRFDPSKGEMMSMWST